ncbi:Zinc finger CCCH domain-containing protein 15 [Sarcoptes scabiei]|uniref:Zinc finger CCCH domain-containing protein 15 n=1 Tax=Sarcoptes scabiei TaxID=52283 RepID=A0A834R3Y6_SARSC|nr:Zinc finger CCCH domain-containing protein 15 [Sarcoptes scabiei]
MPPKKKPEVSKKADQKKKEKIIEDKTFGLKNKKGAKTQKYIQQIQNQVKFGNNPKKNQQEQTHQSKKEEKKKELEELNQIFRPVATQKIDKGVDPKSVLCAFFKSGQCGKGDKCKFSHDLTIERKSEKKSLYFDARNDKEEDNMEDWDEEKLKEVVEKKHGERERKLPSTEIICKFFLEAIETNKYGWFWTCPNGGDNCHYRHALPPGFVLKRDKKSEKKEDITIEELVEIERSKLGFDLPKIDLRSFMKWKQRKIAEKEERERKEIDQKKAEYKAGKNIGLSGREMFTFNPELASEAEMDEGEAAMDIIREAGNEDEEDIKEIDIEEMIKMDKEFNDFEDESTDKIKTTVKKDDSTESNQNDKLEPESEINDINNEPIDESLFALENDDELDDLNLDSCNLND